MLTSELIVISTHDGLQVIQHNATGQKSLSSINGYKKGDIILPFGAATTSPVPTYLTVQLQDDLHITLQPSLLQYVNHSCRPNAFFDTDTMQFVAIENIEAGDELFFFYPSTEWHMAQPFVCTCGNSNCLGTIQGAAHLTPNQRAAYRFTSFIARKFGNGDFVSS